MRSRLANNGVSCMLCWCCCCCCCCLCWCCFYCCCCSVVVVVALTIVAIHIFVQLWSIGVPLVPPMVCKDILGVAASPYNIHGFACHLLQLAFAQLNTSYPCKWWIDIFKTHTNFHGRVSISKLVTIPGMISILRMGNILRMVTIHKDSHYPYNWHNS